MTCKLQHGPAAPVYLIDPQGLALAGDWTVTNLMDVLADDSDKSWTVPASREWQILWVQVQLTTTATVGDRQVEVRIERPPAAMIPVGIWAVAGVVQAASATQNYLFAPGVADLTGLRDTDKLTTPIPVTSILQAGDLLRVWDNAAIDAAADDMQVYIQLATREV